MTKRRVLLLCTKHLYGESLENLLGRLEDVELIGPWVMDESVLNQIEGAEPDVVLIAAESDHMQETSELTAHILDEYPNLTIIHSTLTSNRVRVYSSRELPARSEELLEAIRGV